MDGLIIVFAACAFPIAILLLEQQVAKHVNKQKFDICIEANINREKCLNLLEQEPKGDEK